MSVRAYRVDEIVRRDNSSFNLWHDRAITDWLEANTDFFGSLNGDANGIGCILVEDLERMVRELVPKAEPGTLDAVREDIAWAKAHRREFIDYDCF